MYPLTPEDWTKQTEHDPWPLKLLKLNQATEALTLTTTDSKEGPHQLKLKDDHQS